MKELSNFLYLAQLLGIVGITLIILNWQGIKALFYRKVYKQLTAVIILDGPDKNLAATIENKLIKQLSLFGIKFMHCNKDKIKEVLLNGADPISFLHMGLPDIIISGNLSENLKHDATTLNLTILSSQNELGGYSIEENSKDLAEDVKEAAVEINKQIRKFRNLKEINLKQLKN